MDSNDTNVDTIDTNVANGLRNKIQRVLEFLSLLTVEPFIFAFLFVQSLKRISSHQLLEDKICLQDYGLNATYCQNLPKMSSSEDYLHKKSSILKDVTNFGNYDMAITTIPCLLAALIIGPWTDKYCNAKKALMMTCCVVGICEALIHSANVYFFDKSKYYLLLSQIPGALTGGTLGTYTAIWAYVAATTPAKHRALRMTVVEITMAAASPLGTYIGGKVFNTPPLLKNGQLHNYTTVFIIQMCVYFVTLFWVIFKVNEKKDLNEFSQRFDKRSEDLLSNEEIVCNEQQSEDIEHIHPLRLLFSISNIKDMVKTCCKRRDNYRRLEIWLLFISMFCYLMSNMAVITFMFAFVQKIYNWDSETYSNANAIGDLISAGFTILVVPILLKLLEIRDTSLALVGLVSYFAQNIIRGVFLTEQSYYISLIVGGLGAVTSIGIRAYISKIVAPNELGKVFCFMTTVDSFIPVIGSLVFSKLFNATMDSMPGICYVISAGLNLIPLFIFIWIDIYNRNNNSLN